ncbi:MAG TPA: thioesterase domain-containing protein [Longimicrobiaceae bacterium]|nr:thioesterase domain-containing protein [Longimicrobiaceae bacterium]
MTASTALRDAWITRPTPKPNAHFRLLCIPHAGGGASAFRGWGDAMPPQVEVCPVQQPGREQRMGEPPIDRVEPLVRQLADAVLAGPDLPFAVFGHSNGALIGFELARELRRRGEHGPVQLFASGRRAPDVQSTRPVVYDKPDDEFIAELRELGGTPQEVLEHPELMRILLPLLRADVALNETYVYRDEPPLECPITAYGGLADLKATREETDAWRRHTAAVFTARYFPGDHFFVFSHRDLVLRTLAQDLHDLLVRGGGY